MSDPKDVVFQDHHCASLILQVGDKADKYSHEIEMEPKQLSIIGKGYLSPPDCIVAFSRFLSKDQVIRVMDVIQTVLKETDNAPEPASPDSGGGRAEPSEP